MGIKRLQAKIIASIAFAGIVYIIFAAWSNTEALKEAFRELEFGYLPLILLLTFCNYLFRFLNWQYYLKNLGITINRKDSFMIYLAGFSMSITPGKLGEVIRSVLLKQAKNIPLSKTVSLTFVDRLTDLLALIIIAAVGSISFQYGQNIIWIVGVVLLGIIGIITWRPAAEIVIGLLTRIQGIGKRVGKMRNLYESAYCLLIPRRLIVILFLSVLGWSCEALGFYLTFKAFGIEAGLGAALFIYSFTTILGAISLLPGGLGLTEGSMAGLLILLNIGKGAAAAATLVIRVCTLWFGVLLGAVFLLLCQRKFSVSELVNE